MGHTAHLNVHTTAYLPLVKSMKSTSRKTKQTQGLEPDLKGFIKSQSGIINLPAKTEIDPVQELDDALRTVKNNNEEKKVLDAISKDKKKEIIRPQLMAQWEEFEDTGERPIVRSSDGEIKAYLEIKPDWTHTSKQYMTLKRRLEKLQNQIEALEKNEIIDNKATFNGHKISVVVRSS